MILKFMYIEVVEQEELENKDYQLFLYQKKNSDD